MTQLIRWRLGAWHVKKRVTTRFLPGVTKTVSRPICEGTEYDRFSEGTDGVPTDQRDAPERLTSLAVCGGCRALVDRQPAEPARVPPR